jgi:hypothetical protein
LVQADFTLPDSEFHRRETTLLASRNAVAADFTRFIGLIESGRLDTTLWITHRCPATPVPEEFSRRLDPVQCDVNVMKRSHWQPMRVVRASELSNNPTKRSHMRPIVGPAEAGTRTG